MSFYISLKTSEAKWISADNDLLMKVNGQRGMNEWLMLQFNDDYTMSFKTCFNTYLSCWNDGTIRQMKRVDLWEKFIIEAVDNSNPSSQIAIRTMHNTYLSALPDGTLRHEPNLKSCEKFCYEFKPLMFETARNHYLAVSDKGTISYTDQPVDMSKFTPYFSNRGRIGFKTMHGKFITASGDKLGESNELKENEEFFVKQDIERHKSHGESTITLKTHNHMFVTLSEKDRCLTQKKLDAPGAFETFHASFSTV